MRKTPWGRIHRPPPLTLRAHDFRRRAADWEAAGSSLLGARHAYTSTPSGDKAGVQHILYGIAVCCTDNRQYDKVLDSRTQVKSVFSHDFLHAYPVLVPSAAS
jgi:hypothetical protein